MLRRQHFNFYVQHQANHRKTVIMNILLVLILLLVVGALYLILVPECFGDSNTTYQKGLEMSLGSDVPYWFLAGGIAWYVLIKFSAGYALSNPVQVVMNASHATRVTPELMKHDAKVKEFSDVVDELSIAYGMNSPATYIVENTSEPNAFATGSKNHAGVAITRPLLDMLDRNELSGVMGHELAHVMADDSKTSLTFAYFVSGLSFLVLIGWFIMRHGWWFTGFSDSRDSSSGATGWTITLGLISLGLLIVIAGLVGRVAAIILQFAMSRTREYDADAVSAKVNSDANGLISALTKIDDWVAAQTGRIKKPLPSRYHALYLVSNKTHLFDDHPSTKSRIERLKENMGEE